MRISDWSSDVCSSDLMFADACLHAEAWYCLEALRRLNRKATAFGREDNRLGDGMLRLRLDGRHQGQHLPAIEAFGHDEIGQLRLALGEGASLVESDHLRVAQRLQRLALSAENTHLGRAAGTDPEIGRASCRARGGQSGYI